MNVAWENKINLTAALRMAARLDLHEGVDNHFSLMVSDKPFRFLLNPIEGIGLNFVPVS